MPDTSPTFDRLPAAEVPLVVVMGPTASGKSVLAMHLAERLRGEILCCDAVTVYRKMNIGAAKPSAEDRARVPHHCLDLLVPDQPSTAGDYARVARQRLAEVRDRGRLPVIAGGAGLYLRATLEGLAPSPPRDEPLRERLRARATRRGPATLHRLLLRLDPAAAGKIHPHDQPKLIRSLEVSLLARRPQTEQWRAGRDALEGYDILQLGLEPPRAALYESINRRAAAMFDEGLLGEVEALAREYGDTAVALRSLGYAQALATLRGRLPLQEAIAEAQQGHRRYAKRQLTWFRRNRGVHWLPGFGDEPALQQAALSLVQQHLSKTLVAGESREW